MRRAKLGVAVILSTGLLAACDDSSPPAGTVPIVDAAPTTTTLQETSPEPTTTTEPGPEVTTTSAYDWGPVLCPAAKHPAHHEPCPAYVAPPVTSGGLRPSTATTAPTQGASGGWVIPDYIVQCESKGRWDAENASGAAGPYQLMPEHFGGESALNQSQAAQHAKAAELWNGGKGASHWKACL